MLRRWFSRRGDTVVSLYSAQSAGNGDGCPIVPGDGNNGQWCSGFASGLVLVKGMTMTVFIKSALVLARVAVCNSCQFNWAIVSRRIGGGAEAGSDS